MSRPLKDIVAELEEFPIFSLDTLEERSSTISAYEKSMDSLLILMDNYVQEVECTIVQKQSVSIISRATQNLIYHITYTHNLMRKYSTAIAVYLLDERYDKNDRYCKDFEEKSDIILDLIDYLKNNIVFDLSENIQIDKDVIFQDKLIIEGLGGSIPERIETENELAHASILKLLTCLKYSLNVACDFLSEIKIWSITHYTDKDLEYNYALNYYLYAKEYWPKQVDNFRRHITNQLLRGNVTIEGLEKNRTEIIHEFEYHTDTGKIWYNYSEDYPQLVNELRKLNMKEDQWKHYFKTLLEIEELDHWIEELRNPPESEEDRQKRARLLRSNKIFNLKPANQMRGIDILLLYQFINTRFISEIKTNYEWYALYYILKKNGILKVRLAEDFAKQMTNEEWFPNVDMKCIVKAIKDYVFLEEAKPGNWVVNIRKKSGAKTSKKSLDTILQRYDYLNDCLDEIFAEDISMVKEEKTIINYGNYYDIHDNKTVNQK